MIHLFIIDNVELPDLNYAYRYLAPFTHIIPYSDLNGTCLLADMEKSKYFKLVYARVQNDNENHKDRVYIVARFDHSKFPRMEGYVERRVMPDLDRVLDEIEEMFGLELENQLDAYDEERDLGQTIYIYNADTDGINAAVSGWLRETIMAEVMEDDTPRELIAANDPA